MQIDWESADKLFHFAVAAGAVGAAWVGLLIRNSQARQETSLAKIELTQAQNKAELVAHQVDIQKDLAQKHSENAQTIAVHTAADEAKFDSISRTLVRIDGKLDKMSDNGYRR